MLRLGFALVFLWSAGCTRTRDGSESQAPHPDLKAIVENPRPPGFVDPDGEGLRIWKAERRFYEARGFRLAWISGERPRREAADLLDAIARAGRDGLDPADYDLEGVSTLRASGSRNPFRRRSLDARSALDADLRLTYVFMKLASHLSSGRIEPEGLDPHWHVAPRAVDLPAILHDALESGSVAESLDRLPPAHPEYRALRDALERYRAIQRDGGWPQLPPDFEATRGDRDPAIQTLRRRLAATGDLAGAPPAASQDPHASIYDELVAAAVARVESRHGLRPDGVLDRAAVAAMNVPVERRIEQITLNLERWRWLPERFGDRHLIVNIPTFELVGLDEAEPTIRMRVIVGTRENPTPVFVDRMTHIVFSPHWNVPASIARDETLPAVLEDPAYLDRNQLEVVDGTEVIDPATIDWSLVEPDDFQYRFRQKPGARNALGLVKFMFPNQFSVYLHDTPTDRLFGRAGRDYSHGCVRVEKPAELAAWVLRDQPEWTPDHIAGAMQAGTERTVRLVRPIPVFLLYHTAWIGTDGMTNFRDDLYGHDRRQAALLEAHRSAAPRAARVAG
jgi:murein L,D-transpeptidase YcbB/YkuD